MESLDESFEDTLRFFPFEMGEYYGSSPRRDSFIKNENSIYFGRAFNDTIMELKAGKIVPKLIFDFGEYVQSIEELNRISQDLSSLEELKFLNSEAKLSFEPYAWNMSESSFYSRFTYEKDFYNVFFNRKNQKTQVIEGRISDDINEAFDPYTFTHHFHEDKLGLYMAGKALYKELQKKEAELGQEGFEEYVKGKGKNFAQVAFAAKDSENPVLIVYTMKK